MHFGGGKEKKGEEGSADNGDSGLNNDTTKRLVNKALTSKAGRQILSKIPGGNILSRGLRSCWYTCGN